MMFLIGLFVGFIVAFFFFWKGVQGTIQAHRMGLLDKIVDRIGSEELRDLKCEKCGVTVTYDYHYHEVAKNGIIVDVCSGCFAGKVKV